MAEKKYKWYAAGDVNAFFGLMLDNIAGLVLMVSLLAGIFKFPVDFALMYMVPGTAIGVMVGDLLYFWMANRHAAQTGNHKVTAMPLGLDTPSTFGMVFLVLGPAFAGKLSALVESKGLALDKLREAAAVGGPAADTLAQLNFEAATFAWQIGICSIFVSGLLKFALSFGSNWIRKVVPRAGLLGSLAAIALVLIAFSPLEEISSNPVVGYAALVIVLITLIGRNRLPFKFPGALAAVVVGCVVWYLMVGADHLAENLGYEVQIIHRDQTKLEPAWLPTAWLTAFNFQWVGAFGESIRYMAYVIPFAVATVIGGIDCAESAASAGDDFNTNSVIRVEAFSTLIAAMCGGVIQSTPYIGHPAYKAMGGRSAYVLATALFIGGAGLIGYFSLIFQLIPKAAVFPILIFIGLEITAQSFQVTPRRHYAAVAIACLPAIAKLVVLKVGGFVDKFGASAKLATDEQFLVLKTLAGGFIITSLLWASIVAKIVDRRFATASLYCAVAGVFVLFGVIHSTKSDDEMFLVTDLWSSPTITIVEPGETGLDAGQSISESQFSTTPNQETASIERSKPKFTDPQRATTINFASAYLVMALILFGLGAAMRHELTPINSDEEFEKLEM